MAVDAELVAIVFSVFFEVVRGSGAMAVRQAGPADRRLLQRALRDEAAARPHCRCGAGLTGRRASPRKTRSKTCTTGGRLQSPTQPQRVASPPADAHPAPPRPTPIDAEVWPSIPSDCAVRASPPPSL